jgi:hypothetical protein
MKEANPSQFCRGCGAELRVVRNALQPAEVPDAALSARWEIARAIADKLKKLEEADDLKEVVEDVLPQVEKFLESPEERRLRRLRAGVITALSGLAPVLLLLILGAPINEKDIFGILGLAMAGIAAFMVGIALVINGLLFSLPKIQLNDVKRDALNLKSVEQTAIPASTTSLIEQIAALDPSSRASVIEHTTKHLPVEVAAPKAGQRNTRE